MLARAVARPRLRLSLSAAFSQILRRQRDAHLRQSQPLATPGAGSVPKTSVVHSIDPSTTRNAVQLFPAPKRTWPLHKHSAFSAAHGPSTAKRVRARAVRACASCAPQRTVARLGTERALEESREVEQGTLLCLVGGGRWGCWCRHTAGRVGKWVPNRWRGRKGAISGIHVHLPQERSRWSL